jgi:hypothetical protein
MSFADAPHDSPLRVVPGYRSVATDFAGKRIVIAREEDIPFTVDGVVLEEDTFLAMSAPADVVSPPGHAVRVMTRAWEARPEEPGTVIVKCGATTRLLAIVHDFDCDPSWNEAWVEAALEAIFARAAEEGLRALRLPLLATHRGRLRAHRFMALLRGALVRDEGGDTELRAIWLQREDECGDTLLRALQDAED